MTHRYSAVVAGSNRGTFSVSLSFRDNESQILCVCATNLVDLHYFIQRGALVIFQTSSDLIFSDYSQATSVNKSMSELIVSDYSSA